MDGWRGKDRGIVLSVVEVRTARLGGLRQRTKCEYEGKIGMERPPNWRWPGA